jgi:hypothetical protein
VSAAAALARSAVAAARMWCMRGAGGGLPSAAPSAAARRVDRSDAERPAERRRSST